MTQRNMQISRQTLFLIRSTPEELPIFDMGNGYRESERK